MRAMTTDTVAVRERKALVKSNADLLTDKDRRLAVACYRRYGSELWKDEWLRYFDYAPESRPVRAWERSASYEPERSDIAFWERSEDATRAQMLIQVGKRIDPVLKVLDDVVEATRSSGGRVSRLGKDPVTDNVRAQTIQRLADAAAKLVDRVAPTRGGNMPSLTVATGPGSTVQLMVVSPSAIAEKGHRPLPEDA